MKQILWFRRDLRLRDNKILEKASNIVLSIFIYDAVLTLKKSLQSLRLDLYIFFDTSKNVIT